MTFSSGVGAFVASGVTLASGGGEEAGVGEAVSVGVEVGFSGGLAVGRSVEVGIKLAPTAELISVAGADFPQADRTNAAVRVMTNNMRPTCLLNMWKTFHP